MMMKFVKFLAHSRCPINSSLHSLFIPGNESDTMACLFSPASTKSFMSQSCTAFPQLYTIYISVCSRLASSRSRRWGRVWSTKVYWEKCPWKKRQEVGLSWPDESLQPDGESQSKNFPVEESCLGWQWWALYRPALLNHWLESVTLATIILMSGCHHHTLRRVCDLVLNAEVGCEITNSWT